MQHPYLRGALAALCLSGAAAAQAAPDLIGETLDFLRAYPDINTPFGPSIPSTTVAVGTSDAVSWNGQMLINPDATKIIFQSSVTGYGGTATTFDGYVVSGFDHDIVSVSLASNLTNFVISLTHGQRSLAVNIGTGSTPFSSGIFEVAVQLADAPVPEVPEPAAAGLAGMGLAAVFGWRRRAACQSLKRPQSPLR